MTDRISAEEGALRRGVTALDDTAAGIAANAERIRDRFDELSGFWKGQAASSYTALMAAWDYDFRHVQALLTGLREALAATERDQAAIEQHQGSVISGLDSMMGGGQ
jgi:WXG100 family type VII secretion target